MRTPSFPSGDLRRIAGQRCEITEPVDFGDFGQATHLAHLARLREATRFGVSMCWSLSGVPVWKEEAFFHLLPPSHGVGPQSMRLAERWQQTYRYGAFYLRRGPSFVVLRDSRDPDAIERVVISDGHESLLKLYETCRVTPGTEEAADALVDNGWAVRVADDIVILPYRIARWPVPYLGI